MGLLDFFSNGQNSNGAQSDGTTAPVPDFASIQQSYTNQSLANVSYPMANPNAAAYAPQPVVPQNTTAPITNTIPSPATPQSSTMVAPEPVMSSLSQPVMPVSAMTMPSVDAAPAQPLEVGELPSGDYSDPSKHPVLPEVHPEKGYTQTLPEGIKVTTFDSPVVDSAMSEAPVQNEVPVQTESAPAPEAPAIENAWNQTAPQVQSDPAPVQAPMPESMPAENPVQPMQVDAPVQDPMQVTNELPPLPDLKTEDTTSNELPSLPELNTQTTEIPAEVTVLPEVQKPVEEAPAIEAPALTNLSGGLETGIGSNEDNQIPTMNAPVEEVKQDDVPEVPPMDIPSEVPSAPLDFTPIPVPEVPVEVSVPEPAAVEPVSTETITEVKPEVTEIDTMPEAPAPVEVEETKKEALVESTPMPVQSNFEMSYFKTVGFIGLNASQTNQKVVEKVNDLSAKLSDFAEVFIIDSAKGYAKSIFENAKTKQIELTGMYLKPFHSTYSDETDLGEYDNFTVMVFSNASDKVKNIIKESDILIMPEITGLNNLGTFFEIWSTNSMYPGQHKPLVLLGKGWTNVLTQVKSLFKLTEDDLSFVTVCATSEEALAKISELDKMYMSKEVKQPKRVIDLREEDDEDGLFV